MNRDEEGKMISIKWVITNKETEEEPIAKGTPCGTGVQHLRQTCELFVGTPGLMAMRAVGSRAVTKHVNGTRRAIMLADVKTDFLCGDARRSLYVELLPEDPLAVSGQYVGCMAHETRL